MQQDTLPHTFVALLTACAKKKDLLRGSKIHADVVSMGLLGKNPFVTSALISMYVKCGSLIKAQEVFDELPHRDVVTWNTLIAGYSQWRQGQQALRCYEQLQLEGISPDVATLVCILKASGSIAAVAKGQQIHVQLVQKGMLNKETVVATALVDMYAKCDLIVKAQEVFDKLSVRDIVSWNAIIAGYAQHGHGEKALGFLEQMRLEGFFSTTITFVCILKSCGSIRAIYKGQKVHTEIMYKRLLEKDVAVGTALVDMYAKCDSLEKAQETFEKLTVQDVISWNTIIAGYAQKQHNEQALKCFAQMQLEGFSPDKVTCLCILKACGGIGSLDKGLEIHVDIVQQGLLEKDIVVGNALIDMYGKCGLFAEAQQVFDKLPARDIVTWNTVIIGYIQHRCGEQAFKSFEQMQLEGFFPDRITFVCILKACGMTRAINTGQKVHAQIIEGGFLVKDLFVGNAIVDMYAKCGLVAKAQECFYKLPVQDVVTWNALIVGHVQHGASEQALLCFEKMQHKGISPDATTFACLLKACGHVGATTKGIELHCEIVKEGLLENDIILSAALIGMYARCGLVAKAQEVFDKLPVREVATWSVLILGYVQQGYAEEAMSFFERMQLEGFSANAVVFACMLTACGSTGAVNKGREIYATIVKEGLVEKDTVVGSALVGMYAMCGLFAEAQKVFDKHRLCSVISWNMLISGYIQQGVVEKALQCFDRMQLEGVYLDALTLTSMLEACGNIGARIQGQRIHASIVREGLLEKDIATGNALLGMYTRCGSLLKAQEVFDKLPSKDVVSWNLLISGYTLFGKVEHVFYLLNKMIGQSVEPDSVTFVLLLIACSHTGLLKTSVMCFETMRACYNITPSSEHHACMVEVLACAGHLDKVAAMIKQMPFTVYLTVYPTAYGACSIRRKPRVESLPFEHAVLFFEDTELCVGA